MSTPIHCLTKLKGLRFPQCFMCVNHTDNFFHFSVFSYSEEHLIITACDDNVSAETFWDNIESATRDRQCLWVVGWEIYPLLCAAGFYAQIEFGDFRLPTRSNISALAAGGHPPPQLSGAFVCESPPTIIDCLDVAGHKIKFVDLANWGLERAKFPRVLGASQTKQERDALRSYVTMVRVLNMGSLSPTAAGQGYTRFRTHDLTTKIIVHQDLDARRLERAAYYGGRCEALQVGTAKGPLYYVDIKGMYSTIGERELFPTCLEKQYFTPGGPEFAFSSQKWHSICECVVETEKPWAPCRIGKHTYFPVGRFITTLCEPELQFGWVRGDVVSILGGYRYRVGPVWQAFSRWYQQSLDRLEQIGLRHMKGPLKLAVNSTFGKIGARGKSWKDCEPDGCPDRWAQFWRQSPERDALTQGRVIDGCHQYLSTDYEPGNSLPSIAATMNSYGRVWLFCLMEKAERQNVFYVDTDGLIVNENGLKNLAEFIVPVEPRFGDLTVRSAAQDAWIGGLKHYRLGDDWIQSGVPKDAMRSSDGRAKWREHEPFVYSLWHKQPFKSRTYDRTRYGYRPYSHGSVGPDGRVSPLRADVREIDGVMRTVIYSPNGEIIS